MELSILVAKIFVLYILAVGVGLFTGKLNISKMVDEFSKSSGLSFMTGFTLLVMGGLLVQYHNIWSGPWWVVLITILAWATMIKGFLFIAYPQVLFHFKGVYKNVKPSWGLWLIALGLVLGYFLLAA